MEFMENRRPGAVIKVIGVGGCGGNVVKYLQARNLEGVNYVAVNTDAQALEMTGDAERVQIGESDTRGLGAGAKPEVAREAARADAQRLRGITEDSDMVFVTAGMGGGTGTGASPIVAEIARTSGALTVAVVTRPFSWENRDAHANAGIEELVGYVDSLIVVPNDKLEEVLDDDVGLEESFAASNNVLYNAVAGISEIIHRPGLINVDFADVRTVMTEMGMAMMGSATEKGVDRANRAAQSAIQCPLLDDVDLSGARGLLVNISAARKGFKLKEMNEAMSAIRQKVSNAATVIQGAVFDESLEDAMRVTVIATGLESAVKAPAMRVVAGGGGDEIASPPLPKGIIKPNRDQWNRQRIIDECKNSDDIPAILRRQLS